MLPLFKKGKIFKFRPPQKRNYDVLKIPRKASLKKMRAYPSFKISFFEKSDVIWSLGHSPCSVLELVYQNQEKHF